MARAFAKELDQSYCRPHVTTYSSRSLVQMIIPNYIYTHDAAQSIGRDALIVFRDVKASFGFGSFCASWAYVYYFFSYFFLFMMMIYRVFVRPYRAGRNNYAVIFIHTPTSSFVLKMMARYLYFFFLLGKKKKTNRRPGKLVITAPAGRKSGAQNLAHHAKISKE